ncbi:MAG: RsmG family class I SAM-dependent methyltransferase [Acidimicrobiia bacterium]|nr:RsmG family class I SAM-dependent methyltransferase [Acidimicrobiia bacterium]
MKHRLWTEIAGMAGVQLEQSQLRLLETYQDWLSDEAVAAGGLGPGEPERIDTRHIADSLLFAVAMPMIPTEMWDLGSGAGLPGIPLAILLESTSFVLVEKSGRRVDLLDRALRILELENVEVQHTEIGRLKGPVEALVSRATLGPEETLVIAQRLLRPDGFALMGGSWTEPPSHRGWRTVEITPRSLDHPVWVLIMRRQ